MKVENGSVLKNNDKQLPIMNNWLRAIAIYTFKKQEKQREENALTPFEKAKQSFSRRCFLFKSFIFQTGSMEGSILVFNMPLEMLSVGSYNQHELIWCKVSKNYEISDYRFFCNIHDTLSIKAIEMALKKTCGNKDVFSRISEVFKTEIPLNFHDYMEKLKSRYPKGCDYKRPSHLRLWQGKLVSPYLAGWERESHHSHDEF